MAASSSTTRTLGPCAGIRSSKSLQLQSSDSLLDGFDGCGFKRWNNVQLDDEAGPGRLIIFNADPAVVLGDDSTDDRQAQTRAAFLGRKVGQKQPFFVG